MYIRLIIPYQIILGIISFNTNFSSVFPNAYQYDISKTDLKTRSLNNYSIVFPDAQMAMPLAIKNENTDRWLACYVTLMALESTNLDSNNFGCAFTINRKSIMKVAGDNTPYKLTRDIRAEFIGGDSNTDCNMSLLGKQEMVGCNLLAQFSLAHLFKNDFLKDWFFSIRTTFVNLQQQLIMTLEGTPENRLLDIKHFFSDITKQAKIDSQVRSAVGLENITLTLDGIYTTKNNILEIYYYTGVEIPTNLIYNSAYLFDPIIGNNGNIGLLLGADFHGYFYNSCNKRIGIALEIENHFLLYKTIDRTFDLYNQKYIAGEKGIINVNKPWSRYLPALFLDDPNKQLLIGDISTLPVRIHECNVLDVSLAGLLNIINPSGNKLYLVAGYNLWMSQPEYLELQDRIYPEEYHNFYTCGIKGNSINTTSSESTIKSQLPNNTILKHFTINDLDYGSVASDGAYSQSIFIRGTGISCHGCSVLLGGWYEIGKQKMAPSRIGGWIGCGFEF